MRRVAVLFASVLFMLTTAGGAQAHADLVSMSPEPGSTVSDALSVVTLTFGEDITAMGSSVAVIDPSGADVQAGITIQGATVSVTLGELTSTGEYQVNFRVNSVDGHIVEGSKAFTYNGPVASPTPLAVATVAGGGDDDEFGEGAEMGEGIEGVGVIGIGIVGLVVLGGIVYAMTLRKRR